MKKHGRDAHATVPAAKNLMTAPALASLFPTPPPAPEREAGPRLPGPFASVALEDSLDKLLDYAVPPKAAATIRVGQRVRVPLGRNNRSAYGYVIAVHEHSSYPHIKALFNIDDERVLLTPALMELSRWMSKYYCAPLGTVIDSVIPSAVKKKTGVGYLHMVRIAKGRDEIQIILEKTKAAKRKAILARLLLLEPGQSIELHRLAGESGATAPTIRRLATLGLLTIEDQIDFPKLTAGLSPSAGDEPDTLLNEDQQGRLRRPRPARPRGRVFRQPPPRRHRQRQDRSVFAVHPRGGESRQAGDRARAGNRPHAANRPPLHGSLQERGRPAQRPDRHRTPPLLAANRPGRGRRGGGSAIGRLRAAAAPRLHRGR